MGRSLGCGSREVWTDSVVVNNAGITENQERLHAKNMAEYEKTFNVSVKVGLNPFTTLMLHDVDRDSLSFSSLKFSYRL